jgi:predicted acylesterase/phospholipase RssA
MYTPRDGACLLAILILTGCATKRPVLPTDHTALGTIRGLETSRYWGDENLQDPEAYCLQMREQILSADPAALNRTQHFLAISGGGQNGAFGAGLLNGWTQHGDRPTFRIVTGISTGAIMAPFAFLGEDYDTSLKEMYTRYSTKQIIKKSILSGLFGGKAIADSAPLLGLLERYLDETAIERIAREHRKGRRLLVGTTNMDALRPVIWDIGAIATSDHPDKANLIHRAILASASIPGVFPPILFDVSKGGIEYNELHVDGGVGNQIFLSPTSLSVRRAMDDIGFKGSGTVYMIRNNPTLTHWELVKPTAVAVSSASIGGLTRNQGNTDQYVIYLQALLDKTECRSAQIPASFMVESEEAFDINYMQQLYDLAYERARNGYPWASKPRPGEQALFQD